MHPIYHCFEWRYRLRETGVVNWRYGYTVIGIGLAAIGKPGGDTQLQTYAIVEIEKRLMIFRSSVLGAGRSTALEFDCSNVQRRQIFKRELRDSGMN
ncbi:hypothetical protein L2E82_38951 [Cichorium intybus]|uniref:Uncharacterized protein n=1 Tax=Cichorium intybus TaxID=13427 RepID=A0ACB9AG52_CICIN|nr:hypothetical protein L2E82_38951 [Cichorium intybus]